jgi:predicted dehydrogenase
MYARRHSLQAAVDRVLGRFPFAYWLVPHDIDMMIWTARSPVLSVRAGSPDGATTRSSFISATLRFANGAEGVLETSWCVPSTGGRPSNELFTVRGDQGNRGLRQRARSLHLRFRFYSVLSRHDSVSMRAWSGRRPLPFPAAALCGERTGVMGTAHKPAGGRTG